MATYKVLQDVEAEDKLLGPLSLRQFIYAGIAAVSLYVCYTLAAHGAAFLIVFFLPVAVVTGFFAFPWGRDQPTEVWALAKIRFFLKPRRRIWNQSGVRELVTITAPKHIIANYSNGLSQTEVHSRLHALADTIDSRGWAIKNANLNLYGQSPQAAAGSDRLVEPASLPQPVDSVDIQAADDILDEHNNAGAQRLDTMINQSAKVHRDQLLQSMQAPTPPPAPATQPNNYWFLNQPAAPAAIPNNMVTFNTQVVTPGTPVDNTTTAPLAPPTQDEAQLVAELQERKQQMPGASFYGHLHQIQPLSAQVQAPPAPVPPQPAAPAVSAVVQPVQNAPITAPVTPVAPPVTPVTQAAILSLASNNDLNVATIAREAERTASQGEVVIKLH